MSGPYTPLSPIVTVDSVVCDKGTPQYYVWSIYTAVSPQSAIVSVDSVCWMDGRNGIEPVKY